MAQEVDGRLKKRFLRFRPARKFRDFTVTLFWSHRPPFILNSVLHQMSQKLVIGLFKIKRRFSQNWGKNRIKTCCAILSVKITGRSFLKLVYRDSRTSDIHTVWASSTPGTVPSLNSAYGPAWPVHEATPVSWELSLTSRLGKSRSFRIGAYESKRRFRWAQAMKGVLVQSL